MLVHVNRLPPEIIASIFQLVQIRDAQPCFLERMNPLGAATPVYPKYPEILSHVCSRWRQIALASNHLWSHIDIALSCPFGLKLLPRAQAFVSRAGQIPLDLHILDPGTHPRYQVSSSNSGSRQPSNDSDVESDSDSEGYFDDYTDSDYTDELDISPDLASIFSRPTAIRIIELIVPCKPHESHFTALRNCLANCIPGVLKKLGIYCGDAQSIAPAEELDGSPGLALQLPKAQLEDILSRVSVLHANGMYPYWSSTAYHGLVTLRLTGGAVSIPELKLVDILKSSPGLRILELGVQIECSVSIESSVTPIQLSSLKLLDVSGMRHRDFDTFFRWIAPIPTPFQLTLGIWPDSSAIRTFCALSKVMQLYFDHSGQSTDEASTSVQNMLTLSPHIRVLAVEFNPSFWIEYGDGNDDDDSTQTEQNDGSGGPTSLDALYLLNCRHIKFNDLKQAVAKHSIQKILFRNCDIKNPETYGADDDMLRTLCPVVEIGSIYGPYPTMFSHVKEFV